MTTYLSLTDFAVKYKVSISTLRRKIKANDLAFKFEDGRYLVCDQPISIEQKSHRPSHLPPVKSLSSVLGIASVLPQQPSSPPKEQVMSELKQAYLGILQEKEQMIFELREEIVDLKMLVRALEEQNQKLSGGLSLF